MQDRNLLEQITTLKNMKKDKENFRIAFYHIAKELWSLDYIYTVLDKDSYIKNLKLPLIREYKDLLALQLFSSYEKANTFVLEKGDMFKIKDKKLIARIKKDDFQKIFAPFLATLNWNYILNDGLDNFVDTFDRLVAVVGDKKYITTKKQEEYLKKGNIQMFYKDICLENIELVD